MNDESLLRIILKSQGLLRILRTPRRRFNRPRQLTQEKR
jgi:hypothetical protein